MELGDIEATQRQPLVTAELGVYVHMPFCISRCRYCDFNSYAGLDALGPRYVDALLAEARRAVNCRDGLLAARQAASLYLGGGTPTVLPARLLLRLLVKLKETLPLDVGAEVTIEVNPETVIADTFRRLATAGVNRVSIGAQSAHFHVLEFLGRIHDSSRTEQAVVLARQAGIQRLNLDLIYGTPGESGEDWASSLDWALGLSPDHLSCYALTVEESTPYGRAVAAGVQRAPSEDDLAEKYELACERLRAAGFEHYEVSNWARPGQACRHNLLYWTGGDYLGLGAGAHSFLRGRRSWNVAHPTAYLANVEAGESPEAGSERIGPAERRLEALWLGLRLAAGLREESLEALGANQRALGEMLDSGLGERHDGRFRLTERGLFLADAIVADLAAGARVG